MRKQYAEKKVQAKKFSSGGKLVAKEVVLNHESVYDYENFFPIWHFGLSTDPIFTGQCNGVYSACYIGGYAMETKCHLGNLCLLDFPEEEPGKGDTDIRNHKISYVLDELKKAKNFYPN
jgi:putative lipase involved disintegration of autophagic bodies